MTTIDERIGEDWNGLSRTSVEWMKKQIDVINMMKENPKEDIDLIGLSAMLNNLIYDMEVDAKFTVEQLMSDLVALVITRDLHFTRYYQIDARNTLHVMYCKYREENRDYLKKLVEEDLQVLYERAINDYRNNAFMNEDLDRSKFALLPKEVPWTMDEILDKGVNDLVDMLIEAMDKNKD